MELIQQQAIAYLKGELAENERRTFEEELARSDDLRAELARSREMLDLLEAATDEATSRHAYAIIQEAIKANASDIHIVQEPNEAIVYFRIDGQLQEAERMLKEACQPVLDKWKLMAECNVSLRNLPQDGRIQIRYQQKSYELRLCFLPTIDGERVTARILDKSSPFLGMDSLGITPAQHEAIQRLIERPAGLVVVTGHVASGKTTLLYNMLAHLRDRNQNRQNIITVEDPVEVNLTGISQVGANQKIGMTIPAGLRSCLRSDPDVVMIGELRNLETANLGVELAITGHLVLTPLHTPDAVGSIQRLKDMGVVPFLVAQCLAGVVAQRLVRKVCMECTEEYQPAPEALKKAGLTVKDGPFRRGKGCPSCRNTGFRGRTGLFEVLEIEDRLRPLMAAETPSDALWQATFGSTGGSLWDDARARIRAGITTVEEVNWALFDYPYPPAL